MNPLSRSLRARIAAGTAVLLTALSVVVPLMDRGQDLTAVALSDPGQTAGYVDHHHGVCLQHSATAWSPAARADLPSERFTPHSRTPPRATHWPGRPVRSVHNSRGPPLG